MIQILGLSTSIQAEIDQSNKDLLCDEVPLQYGLNPNNNHEEKRLHAQIESVDSEKLRPQPQPYVL